MSDYDLKPITKQAVPRAIERAERYRLLNEPRQAESICRDVLHVDRDNHEALVTMLLALTDQFDKGAHVSIEHAKEVLPRFADPYERSYYEGIIYERWAKAQLAAGAFGHAVYEWFEHAMQCYAKAQELSPAGNDDAILRWNTIVRILRRHSELRPRPPEHAASMDFGDSAPLP